MGPLPRRGGATPTRLLPGLVLGLVVGLGTAGCSGSPAPSGPTPATSASAPSAVASPAPTGTPSEQASPGGAQAALDPCTVLDAARVSKLTGVAVGPGQSSEVTGSRLCTWVPKDASSSDAALFTAQVGPAQGGSLSDAEAPLRKQFGGKVEKTTVPGAEDARYISGKAANAQVIDVLALRGDVFYQVLAASPRTVTGHRAGVYKMVEALLAG